MNKLERKRKEIDERYQTFTILQHYRNMDFPDNTIFLVSNNFLILSEYFVSKFCTNGYVVALDTVLITHILNFLSSFKSYIERKIYKIKHLKISIYKQDLLNIIQKYWKSKRNQTIVDNIINIRNVFEHEEIKGISRKCIYGADKTEYHLMYNDIDLIDLFSDGMQSLYDLNDEIKNFIENKLNNCNLRECCLFKLAFSERFNDGFTTDLFPKPTEEEINYYRQLIDDLMK